MKHSQEKQLPTTDEEFMKEALKDADIVYHLAGITDVAYTKQNQMKKKIEK